MKAVLFEADNVEGFAFVAAALSTIFSAIEKYDLLERKSINEIDPLIADTSRYTIYEFDDVLNVLFRWTRKTESNDTRDLTFYFYIAFFAFCTHVSRNMIPYLCGIFKNDHTNYNGSVVPLFATACAQFYKIVLMFRVLASMVSGSSTKCRIIWNN